MVTELSPEEIWSLVDSSLFAHLGCSAQGETYVVPISYARDGDRLVGVTSVGKKVEMMRENPRVCVQVDDIQSLTRWRSAVLWGEFRELSGAERSQAAGLLLDKYGLVFEESEGEARRGRDVTPPRLDGQPEPRIAYEIQITKLTGRAEGQ